MTYTDPFTDKTLNDLIARVDALDADDDSWTWWDNDPDVAWGMDPDVDKSYYASLRVILEDAGWESCYHGERARLHYNIKTGGSDTYRGVWDLLDNLHPDARDRVDRLINQPEGLSDTDLQGFWEWDLPDFLRETFHPENGTQYVNYDSKVYGCGRQGGYANSADMERHREGKTMILLAQFLERSRHWYNSREYGEDLAERAIERDIEDQTEALASPRPDRIEA